MKGSERKKETKETINPFILNIEPASQQGTMKKGKVFDMFDMLPFDRKQNDLFHTLDRIEKNFFGDFEKEFSAIRTDIVEKEDSFLLQAELPGFHKEDIDIILNGTMLTITAKQDETSEDKTDRFVRRERHCGSFTRSFDVSNIDVRSISAQYQDGVLEVTLPKAAPPSIPASQQIAIE